MLTLYLYAYHNLVFWSIYDIIIGCSISGVLNAELRHISVCIFLSLCSDAFHCHALRNRNLKKIILLTPSLYPSRFICECFLNFFETVMYIVLGIFFGVGAYICLAIKQAKCNTYLYLFHPVTHQLDQVAQYRYLLYYQD